MRFFYNHEPMSDTDFEAASAENLQRCFGGASLFNTAHPLDIAEARDADNRPSPDAQLSLAALRAAVANLMSQGGVMENRPRTVVLNPAHYEWFQKMQAASELQETLLARMPGLSEMLAWRYAVKRVFGDHLRFWELEP